MRNGEFELEAFSLSQMKSVRFSLRIVFSIFFGVSELYVGMTDTLLADIVSAANEALGLSGTESLHYEFAGNDVNGVVSLSFQPVRILGALSELSSAKECEYHIDWTVKTLDRLPAARASLYNFQRNSKIFEKSI